MLKKEDKAVKVKPAEVLIWIQSDRNQLGVVSFRFCTQKKEFEKVCTTRNRLFDIRVYARRCLLPIKTIRLNEVKDKTNINIMM